jgi:hypothetical protein
MALGIIKQTSRAVLSMAFSLLFFPLLPIALYCIYFAYWVYSLSYVYTSTSAAWNSTITGVTSDAGLEMQPTDDSITYAMWAYLFWYYLHEQSNAPLCLCSCYIYADLKNVSLLPGFSGLLK